MGIGLGIVLIVLGAICLFALRGVDVPFVSDGPLGWILIVAGVLALALALIMQAQRGRTKHVQETNYNGPPPRI